MRIYSNSFELMSEMGRELNSYGQTVKPKTYQNKVIEGNEDFITKELICQQYCLTSLGDPVWLFIFSHSKEWADAEFQERITFEPNGEPWNPGEAWKLRRDLWEQFLVKEEISFVGNETHKEYHEIFEYTYSERIMKPVYFNGTVMPKIMAIIQLLKSDQDTRKAVLNIYGTDNYNEDEDSDHYDGSRRIPCSMYYDFLIRQNGKGEKVLHICYHQRSSDFVTHFGNDVYLAWRLMEYVAQEVGVKPGYLYHTIDSLHSYKKDWKYLNTNLEDLQEKF
jgi:thymidylate synthase